MLKFSLLDYIPLLLEWELLQVQELTHRLRCLFEVDKSMEEVSVVP
jgi:hypothetical protein